MSIGWATDVPSVPDHAHLIPWPSPGHSWAWRQPAIRLGARPGTAACLTRARTQRGLTLAELLLTLGLLSMLAGLTGLEVARFLGVIWLQVEARQLATDLNVARGTAVLRNTRARVTFAADRYLVRYDLGEPREVHARIDHGIRIASVPRSGALRFFPTGNADNGTVVLTTSSGRRSSVVVNQRGRIVIR